MNENESYYCLGLAGESLYNTCINCDLTISCNCADSNGEGIIGNLNESSFEHIWKEGKSQTFRTELSNGKFPTTMCINCPSLRKINDKTSTEKILKSDYPKGFLIENILACNFLCNCPRYSLHKHRNKFKMSLDDVEKISKLCKQCEATNVYYFNLNEPFCSNTILEELQLLKLHNPNLDIMISTNASLINNDKSRLAALLLTELICSIDGASQETTSIYQINIKFDIILENLKLLNALKKQIGSKTIVTWKYLAFPWNDHESEINLAINLAKNTGCDRIAFCIGHNSGKETSKLFDQLFFKKLTNMQLGEYYIIPFS